MKKQTKEDWEKELKEVYETAASFDDKSDIDCVIDYVRNLLSTHNQELIKEVEGMKVGMNLSDYSGDTVDGESRRAYNQALNDVIQLLKSKGGR
jgi:hypothetical protein